MKFTEFDFHPDLMNGVEALGFENATPIQEQAIPVILDGKDMIASAQTGTGKTAAFLLPIINQILTSTKSDTMKALIIVPTRELAIQIDQQMEGLSYFCQISSIAVYGGNDGISFAQEQTALSQGADMIICTPGRMISHLAQNYVKTSELKYLILDEADRMLDMGFHEDIIKILSYLPQKRQNLMFSATMPHQIKLLAKKVLNDPFEISIATSKPADKILQIAYVVYNNQKIPLVLYLLGSQKAKSVLIFCSTKSSAKDLSRELKAAKLAVEDIHSDLDQINREQVLMDFKNKKLHILVATDILSRGIDIEDIDLIINFDVPQDGEDYIHRIGRTARAEADGVAISLINDKDQAKFAVIEKLLGKEVYKGKVPVQFGDGPKYNPKERRGNFKKFSRKKSKRK